MIILENTYIRYKVMNIINKLLANYRKKTLNNTNFSIISNNCWGGCAYSYYGLPYLSPTVGCYIFADDYLKFIKNLRYYLSLDLQFITYKESRYKESLETRNHTNVPIGKLDDVEIVFLHYKDEKEAAEKWKRRKKRVNFDNIILKFSQQNMCTEEHLKEFDNINFDKKMMFVNREREEYSSSIYYHGYENSDGVFNDTKFFYDYMNLTEFLNSPVSKYPQNLFDETGSEFYHD